MNVLRMSLVGHDSVGWIWGVCIEDLELFRTEPLARGDLAAALFSIQRDRSRRNPFFLSISDEDLFLLLEGFFFEALHDALQASAEEQVWARHLVSPSVPVAVWSRMYLVGHDEHQERLLVWHDGQRRTFLLPAGSFDKELAAVRERLEASVPSAFSPS